MNPTMDAIAEKPQTDLSMDVAPTSPTSFICHTTPLKHIIAHAVDLLGREQVNEQTDNLVEALNERDVM